MDKNKIIEIINQYDPARLLKMGAPEDEYESEAHAIAKLANQKLNLEDFQVEVKKIFVKYFDDDQHFYRLNEMSSDIYQACFHN